MFTTVDPNCAGGQSQIIAKCPKCALQFSAQILSNKTYVQPMNDEQRYVEMPSSDGTVERDQETAKLIICLLRGSQCRYGMSSSLLLELLRQKWSLDTELPLQRDLDYFLRTRMADQVEYLDGLYRYRFVQRNLQPNSNTCKHHQHEVTDMCKLEEQSSHAESKQKETVLKRKAVVRDNVPYKYVRDVFKELLDVRNEVVVRIDPRSAPNSKILRNRTKSCPPLSEEKMMELMEEWEQKFCGDVRELIRFLKVVNESFVEQNGHFSRLDFRTYFGLSLERFGFLSYNDLVSLGFLDKVVWNNERIYCVNPKVLQISFLRPVKTALKVRYHMRAIGLSGIDIKELFNIKGFEKKETEDDILEMLADASTRDAFIVKVIPNALDGVPNFHGTIMIWNNEGVEIPTKYV